MGNKNPALQQETLGYVPCVYNIVCLLSVEPEWIPRTENQIADFISHIQDFDDWQLHPSVFCWLNSRWGLCTVDRFASFYNTQYLGLIAVSVTQDLRQ